MRNDLRHRPSGTGQKDLAARERRLDARGELRLRPGDIAHDHGTSAADQSRSGADAGN
jgi:hypothetical protein